ncbi:hypothetical protein [Acidithiobacillus thiooxidans]|nr:hypothetical protein [Acidithiobacillus thiooxidans]
MLLNGLKEKTSNWLLDMNSLGLFMGMLGLCGVRQAETMEIMIPAPMASF